MERKVPPLQDLIERLIDLDYRISDEARHLLIGLGKESVPALERVLQQVSIESQKMPIYVTLMNIKNVEAATVLLSQFFKETDNSLRGVIAEGLGLAKYQEAGPILEQTLNNAVTSFLGKGQETIHHLISGQKQLKYSSLC